MSKFAKHKFFMPIRAVVAIRKECCKSTLTEAWQYINSDSCVIKKMMIFPVGDHYDMTTGAHVYENITARPVDRMDYPKFILGLS